MANDKIKTDYPGVRYRDYPDGKHGGKPDRGFFIRYKRNGKSIEEAVGYKSASMNPGKASLIRSEIIQNIRRGRRPMSLREKREMDEARRVAEEQRKLEEEQASYTFGELAEEYIEWAKVNKKSWKDDAQRYRTHLEPRFGAKPLRDISGLDLERMKNDLFKKNKLSPATVKHCLVLVRQMYNKAIIWDFYSGINPVSKVKMPVVNNKRVNFFQQEEADRLLDELAKSSIQVHDQALLSLQSGLRFGEIAALTWIDLNFEQNTINVRDPKGESRHAYITPAIHEMFRSRMPENPHPTDLIFPARNGNVQHSVSNAFDRAVKRLGFNEGVTDRKDKLIFHSLRHTFASWLAIQGESLLAIRDLMGHKTLAITERYAHLLPDQKQAAVAKLAMNFKKQQQSKAKIVDLRDATR